MSFGDLSDILQPHRTEITEIVCLKVFGLILFNGTDNVFSDELTFLDFEFTGAVACNTGAEDVCFCINHLAGSSADIACCFNFHVYMIFFSNILVFVNISCFHFWNSRSFC